MTRPPIGDGSSGPSRTRLGDAASLRGEVLRREQVALNLAQADLCWALNLVATGERDQPQTLETIRERAQRRKAS